MVKTQEASRTEPRSLKSSSECNVKMFEVVYTSHGGDWKFFYTGTNLSLTGPGQTMDPLFVTHTEEWISLSDFLFMSPADVALQSWGERSDVIRPGNSRLLYHI